MRGTRRRGPKPAPIARLTTDARRVIDTSGATKSTLATICDFDHLQTFSAILHHDFRATPLTLRRLARLGQVLGIDRVFEEVSR